MTPRVDLDSVVNGVRAGRLDFPDFARAVTPAARAIAADIGRRWRLPTWLGADDLEQEVLLAAWKFVWEYDPERGVSAGSYVIWNAYDKAKKTAHKARGAYRHRHGDGSPSRFERAASEVLHGLEMDLEGLSPREKGLALAVGEHAFSEPTQYDECARAEEAAQAERACKTAGELLAIRAIVEAGNIEVAAKRVYEDAARRLALRLGSEAQARQWIVREARRVVERIEAARAA